VAVGGGAGALLRYWLSSAVQSRLGPDGLPWGTIAVNVIGCFVMGVVAALADRRESLTPEIRAFLAVGVLGGFTTFSAFANESVNAVRAGAPGTAALNVGLSVAVCLVAVWVGRLVGAGLSR
jgi:CrcB protein